MAKAHSCTFPYNVFCLFQNVVLLTYFDIAQHFIYHSYIIEWKIDESKGFAPWCGNIVDGIIALNREADIGSVVEAGVAFYKTFGGYEGGDILWVVG